MIRRNCPVKALRKSKRSSRQVIYSHLAVSKRAGHPSPAKSRDKGTLPLSSQMAWRLEENRPHNRPSVHFLKEGGTRVPLYFCHIRRCAANRYQNTIDWMRVTDNDTDLSRFTHPFFSHDVAGYPHAAHGGSFRIRPRLHVDNLSIERLLSEAKNRKDFGRNQPKSNEEELTNELQFA